MILLAELLRRIEADGPYLWVPAPLVGGYEVSEEFRNAKEEYFHPRFPSEDYESAAQIISDYLDDCMRKAKLDHVAYPCSPAEFTDSALFLIAELGSSYAAVTLSTWRTFICRDLRYAIAATQGAFAAAEEPFVRDNLRTFVLETFDVGVLFPGWEERMSSTVPPDLMDFLRRIAGSRYETLDPNDARLFVDGTSVFPKRED